MYEIYSLRFIDFYGNVGKHTISMDPMGKGNHLTLPETNIASENSPSQKEIHPPTIDVQGLCQT